MGKPYAYKKDHRPHRWRSLLAGAVADGIRYLSPGKEPKTIVYKKGALPVSGARTLLFVYNANGGIYPGIADIAHKAFFPDSYPCNLCFQAFGMVGKKKGWTTFLDSIPLMKEEYHKDIFRKNFRYQGPLPLVLIADEQDTAVLLTAGDINQAKSLEELIAMLRKALGPSL